MRALEHDICIKLVDRKNLGDRNIRILIHWRAANLNIMNACFKSLIFKNSLIDVLVFLTAKDF